MNGFDIALLVFMGILVAIGLLKGLVRILIGMAALVTAFLVACLYHAPLADRLSSLDVPGGVLKLISYVLLFLGVMLLGGVAAWLLRKLIKAAMLSWVDRIAGAALGLLAAMLTASLLVMPLVAYLPDGGRLLDGSILAPYVAAVADFATHVVPEDLAEKYRQGIETIRDHWRGATEETVSVPDRGSYLPG
jgi:membrane protein required for colicin V production